MEFTVGNLWLLISAALVFLMHAGFACVESGFTQSKNTVNILFKNFAILSIGLLSYYLIGFSLMYPGDSFAGGLIGFNGFGIDLIKGWDTATYNANYTLLTDFIFQAMFAATTATIISGAVAERIRLPSFLLFATLFVTLCYPIIGMWKWGGGFLDAAGFYDFAGSTLVHSVGGWAALIASMLVGPRKTNSPHPHNIPLATLGVFFLWFGWYGFNGGSVLSADASGLSLVFVNTTLGAAAGVIGALICSWLPSRRFDHSFALNGALGGLVAITASADIMTPGLAILIGFIAGIIIPAAIRFLDHFIDDPVGAVSVHLVCGIFGTLMIGIIGPKAGLQQFLVQLGGILAIGIFVCTFTIAILGLMKKISGIRVPEDVEEKGLDKAEHDLSAYRGLYIGDQE